MTSLEKGQQLLATITIENLLESLDSDMAVVDRSQQVVIWNHAMESHFGPREQAYGRKLSELFPKFCQEYQGQVWMDVFCQRVLQRGQTWTIRRYPLKTVQGHIHYFDIKASALYDTNKRILGAVIVMNDMTEQIRLENQLLRHARTTSLSNLGANVAHEIRNPLNAIALSIQLLKEDLIEGTAREQLIKPIQDILAEIQRLNGIVSRFLDFSRPPEFKPAPENVNFIIEKTLKLLGKEAQKYNIQIELDLHKRLPLVPIDQEQFSQALYNIILNAIQVMKEEGGGQLKISTSQTREYLLIQIKDSGPGLPEEKGRIFDLFYSTREDGTGLGLPISNQIIENHGGTIVAENNLVRGACFSIYLPLKEK